MNETADGGIEIWHAGRPLPCRVFYEKDPYLSQGAIVANQRLGAVPPSGAGSPRGGVDLTELPGIGPYGALKLISELGLDMRGAWQCGPWIS